jgi:hypothetical protein
MRRGLSFEISRSDFDSLWSKACYYCGDPIKTIGIDRKINSVGYELSNVVPCCKPCNFLKRTNDHDIFVSRCVQIARNLAG